MLDVISLSEGQAGGPSDNGTPAKKPKRFQCGRCQRLFARLEHLQRHERIHTNEKPFSCQQCNHRFTRSDLLIRHERLSHKDTTDKTGTDGGPSNESVPVPRRMSEHKRTSTDAGFDDPYRLPPPAIATSPMGGLGDYHAHSVPNSSATPVHLSVEQNHDLPLNTLSMAAEQAALQDVFTTPTTNTHAMPPEVALGHNTSVDGLPYQPTTIGGHMLGLEFEDSLESLNSFLDNGPFATYHFSSLISTEQPLPFFSPGSNSYQHPDFVNDGGVPGLPGQFMKTAGNMDEPNSFSRFGSRLPSLQPEERLHETHHASVRRPLHEVSLSDRQDLLSKLAEFSFVIPPGFQFPSRLALSRYIAGYVNGFHEHLPCLHMQTMSAKRCSIELFLAMAAVGAQYCFEGEKGVELFHVSQAIAAQRIRRRDARLATFHRRAESDQSSQIHGDGYSSRQSSIAAVHMQGQPVSGPLGLPPETEISGHAPSEREDLMQTAQALFILMAMATWAKHKEILREALAIQSVLATLVRDDGLKSHPIPDDISWEQWIAIETTKRTKLIVFCFFNLHCIVYNIPSLILSSEVKLTLPCTAAEFKAPTAAKWREARRNKGSPELNFQEALRRLFSRDGKGIAEWNSSLGNYVLIHAIIQHIFLARQIGRCRFDGDGDLAAEDVSAIEQGLRNWQLGWKRNPESSLDPLDPNGPVAFNSTALLRLAYIRLNIDIGPGRALDTRDPVQIANAFRDSPAIKRTPKLVRAVLHSAHALSIPVKIGIRLVAQTQTFHWSIQHSLCSLECAFLLSKWLGALALAQPDPEVTEDERRISSLVKTMLDETEFAVSSHMPLESPVTIKQLSAGVLRVWAKIFRGAQTWAIVDVIGSSLQIYADMLEAD